MRYFLCCVALLCAVGCSSVPANNANPQDGGGDWRNWIPGIAEDAWETFDANAGLDYQLGAHVKFTELAKLGVFDYADFGFFGLDSGIFNGDYQFPNMNPQGDSGAWDLSAKIGFGFGADATLHSWEVVDLLSSIVGIGYWSFDQD